MKQKISNVKTNLARQTYQQYTEQGLSMVPPFKGYGLKLIQFAIDHPDMYRQLFFTESDLSYTDYFDKVVDWDKIIPAIEESLSLNEADAKWLFRNMLFYVHGMASVFISSSCIMSEEEISESLGELCRGMIMQLKSPKDERTKLIPQENGSIAGNLDEYIKGKRNVIIGYDQDRQAYRIRIDCILYFEAVGEKVFAYTRENVYSIHQRLYKIEELCKDCAFIRSSKSTLINLKKVNSIRPEKNGRGIVSLINNETVLTNRSYYHNVVEKFKEIY